MADKVQGPVKFIYAENKPGVANYFVRYTKGEYLFMRGEPLEVADPDDIALLRKDPKLKEVKE